MIAYEVTVNFYRPSLADTEEKDEVYSQRKSENLSGLKISRLQLWPVSLNLRL